MKAVTKFEKEATEMEVANCVVKLRKVCTDRQDGFYEVMVELLVKKAYTREEVETGIEDVICNCSRSLISVSDVVKACEKARYANVPTGVGVWIADGKKWCGDKEYPSEIPMEAPERPSWQHAYDRASNNWVVL